MNYEVDLPVELTYFELSNLTYGWDHFHGHDADLFQSRDNQPDSCIISGPVQVLDEARQIIKQFQAKNTMIMMELKHAQVESIREELMQKACHPRRIRAWVEQGFDPFDEI
jgi:NAD(P)H-flavin reductase